MDFLKEILGDELYERVETAVREHNGKEENKDRQIKLANLAKGDYVSTAKYTALDTENQTNVSKLSEANNLIESLKKSAKGDEKLQQQVADYQARVAELESELAQTKINAAIKVGLLAADAKDVDYLTYKLKEKDEKMELDDQGNIKGWDDKLAALKLQLPAQFASGKDTGRYDGFRPMDKGGNPQNQVGLTKTELLKKPYPERQRIFEENPEQYREIMKG